MALNISIFSVPMLIFLVAVVVIVAAIIALTVIERRLGKKAREKKEYEETYYQKKLSAIMALQSDQDGFLIALDKVVREFFSEELGYKTMGRYTQLIKDLNQRQKAKEAKFCERMQEALYSGERVDIKLLIALHSEIRAFVLQKERAVAPEQAATKNQGSAINQNIMMYLQEGMNRGYNLQQLREKLVKAGLDEHEVDKGIIHIQQQKPRMEQNTEKRILTNFLNPKGKDLDIIKKGVEEKDEIGKAEIIEVISHKEKPIETQSPPKRVEYPKEEPEEYKKIGSLNDLERIKRKIETRKEGILE